MTRVLFVSVIFATGCYIQIDTSYVPNIVVQSKEGQFYVQLLYLLLDAMPDRHLLRSQHWHPLDCMKLFLGTNYVVLKILFFFQICSDRLACFSIFYSKINTVQDRVLL